MTPTAHHSRHWFDQFFPSNEAIGDLAAQQFGWHRHQQGDYCMRCGLTGNRAGHSETGCAHCRDRSIAWDRLWRLGPYTPPLSDWIKRLKFHRTWYWAYWFADQLAEVLPSFDHSTTLICPVPLHWRRRWLRSYDQSTLIARQLSKKTGIPFGHLLRRTRYTPAQSGMPSRTRRLKNVHRAFEARSKKLAGQTILLVDDIVTTGATATACVKALRQHGAGDIHLITVAVTDTLSVPSMIQNSINGCND